MKHKLIPAFALCSALFLQSLPADAYYESAEEIALSLRVNEFEDGTYADENEIHTIHISPDAAAKGTSLHLGVYIEAERCEISLLGIKLQSDCDTITFNADTLLSPASPAYTTEMPFVIPGTEDAIMSRFKPYCLGKINSSKQYSPGCYTCNLNPDPTDNSLTAYWMYGILQATEFLGGASDTFSFVDFDLEVAPGTPAGTYHLSFLTNADARQAETDRLTFLVSDNGTLQKSEYHNMIPTLNDLTIVVDEGTAPEWNDFRLGDVNGDAVINAEDAAALLIYCAEIGAGADASLDAPDGITPEQLLAQADTNSDGSYTATDAANILLYAAESGASGSASWDKIL